MKTIDFIKFANEYQAECTWSIHADLVRFLETGDPDSISPAAARIAWSFFDTHEHREAIDDIRKVVIALERIGFSEDEVTKMRNRS